MEAEQGIRGSRMWRQAVRIVALPLLCLAVSSCNTAGFKEAFMSLDSSGNRRREHFFTDTEEIHCIGKMASGRKDVTVEGVLTAQQLWDPRVESFRDVDAYVTSEEIAPGAGKDIVVDFHFKRKNDEDPYLPGKYTCELSIDGEVEEVVPFDIAFPECPTAPIHPGDRCAGFVLPRSVCPGAVKQPCKCGESGAWEC